MEGEEQRLTDEAPKKRRYRKAVADAPRSGVDDREDDERGLDERDATEGRLSEEDQRYFDQFQGSQFDSALPDLPKIPGFHLFWATTTNPRDTIQSRLNKGYQFVERSEVPGWDTFSLKTGDYAGKIGVNEMIAMKIPLRLWKLMMRESHHIRPLQEEEALKARLNSIKEQAQEVGGDIEEGDGTAGLVQRAREPVFEG